MFNKLYEFIEKIRHDSKVSSYDEAATKQGIILPILHIMGWDVYNVDEVKPEFTVENKKVDYALHINKTLMFFIEVKRAEEDLDKHQKQLLESRRAKRS